MKPLIAACTITIASVALSAAAQQPTFITIGTGGVTGIYYPAGGAICRMMAKTRSEHGIRCGAESTDGSVYNVNAIESGEIDFGVAQSDVHYKAYNGIGSFARQGANKKLRSVFSIHAEPFTVVARQDANIESFDDLKGKRVNVGNPGSGQRDTMEVLMKQMGWTMDDFALVSELQSHEQSQALCDDRIDAMVYTVGHPAGSIKEATTACDSVLVSVDNDAVKELVQNNPYYRFSVIPGGTYRGSGNDVKTFGVGATLVTSADMPDKVVYSLVKAVFSNLDQFRSLHPAFAELDPKQMIKEGLSAPLHPGAAKYYREAGLLN